MSEILRTATVNITKMLKPQQVDVIKATAVEFGKVFEYYANLACELKSCNGNEVHRQGYMTSREKYPNLPSALNQSARSKACGCVMGYNSNVPRYNKLIDYKNRKYALRALKKGEEFTPKPLKEEWDYKGHHKGLSYTMNVRAMSILKDNISIGTIGKRVNVSVKNPKWFDAKYPSKRFYSGAITIDPKSNEIFLHLTYVLQDENSQDRIFYESKKPSVEELNESNTIGIDRGIYHPIATSNGILISSKPYYAVQRKYVYNAESLKQKSTSSSRKRLRAQSGKRRLFNNDVNHCLSKKIANIPNAKCVVFENLTNIVLNKMTDNKKKSKKMTVWLHAWSFADLEFKTTYKCQEKGIFVKFVNPYNTSKMCSSCHGLSFASRYKNWFKCPKCGHKEHSDINAGKNIRDRYLENLRNSLRSHSTDHDVSGVLVSN